MASTISGIRAMQVIDSRGFPTVRAFVTLQSGVVGSATAPSGVSTGEKEAFELRNRDDGPFFGRAVYHAVHNVNDVIAPRLLGHDPSRQNEIDRLLIELDATASKSKLGANAVLAVSMATARAAAADLNLPLYRYLGGAGASELPLPMLTLIDGGLHADNNLNFQEFMVVPLGASTFTHAMRLAVETSYSLKELLRERGVSTAVGDEGGFVLGFKDHDDALATIVQAIERAGYRPGEDIAIALDIAADAFHVDDGDNYVIPAYGAKHLDTDDLLEIYQSLVRHFPIVSIEDAFYEHDFDGFRRLTSNLTGRVQIVGDDLYATRASCIQRGVKDHLTNAAVIKLNQIGTITEVNEAVKACREAGWSVILSHRSGETEDAFLADLAVAEVADQIKSGSVCRGERVAKYNRLLEIEDELGNSAHFAGKGALHLAM